MLEYQKDDLNAENEEISDNLESLKIKMPLLSASHNSNRKDQISTARTICSDSVRGIEDILIMNALEGLQKNLLEDGEKENNGRKERERAKGGSEEQGQGVREKEVTMKGGNLKGTSKVC